MLILTRKANQSVVLGNSIRVTVLEVTSSGVRLGFSAPDDVSIYREELYREAAEVNRAALGDTDRAEEDRSKPRAPRQR